MADFKTIEVVNRRAVPQEGMFDGQVIVFEPGQSRHFTPNVGIALVERSALKLNLASGLVTVYGLGIVGDPAYPVDPLDGTLAKKNDLEILDRTDDHRLTETEPKALSSAGVESLGVGKVEKTVGQLPGAEDDEAAVEAPVGAQPAPAAEMKPVKFRNEAAERRQKSGGQGRVHVKGQG